MGAGTGAAAHGDAAAVAVVIPVLNGARHIGETLDSVLAQTHAPSEIVVVDDGCTDATAEIAAARPGVRVVRNTGKGVAQARRFGIDHTTAPLIALLDHDDLWHFDHLRVLVAVLDGQPHAAAALCHPVLFADGVAPSYDPPSVDPIASDPWDAFPGCFANAASSALMRRSALDAVGGWNVTGFDAANDMYMWFRLAEWGPLLVNRSATAAYRMHQGAMNVSARASGAEYADQIAATAEAAVTARLARFADEAPALERRRLVAQALRHLGSGVFRGDMSEVARGARLLEAGTHGEPPERIGVAFHPLFWLIDGNVGAAPADHDIYRPLIAGWPSTARRTAPFRLRYLALRPLLMSALRRPTDAWRWRWLLEAARQRYLPAASPG